MKKNKFPIWSVVISLIQNVFQFFVFLIILDAGDTQFEVAMISMSLFIYLTVLGFYNTWALTHDKFVAGLHNDLTKMKKLIDDNYDETHEGDLLDNVVKELDKHQMLFYINSFFLFIMFILNLVNILTNLW